MSDWTADDMQALGSHHAAVEARLDLEATMATLVDDPIYQLWPIGLEMRGEAFVRRYYEHLMGSFIPSTRAYALLDQWVNENSLVQEYDIDVEADGRVTRHRVVGVLFREGDRLGGERVFASERCLRLMAGDDLLDELQSHPDHRI